MVKMTYPGLKDPVRDFEALKPLVLQLRKMQLLCRPFGRDYHAIAIALDAVDSTAYHFTRRPHFYATIERGPG